MCSVLVFCLVIGLIQFFRKKTNQPEILPSPTESKIYIHFKTIEHTKLNAEIHVELLIILR